MIDINRKVLYLFLFQGKTRTKDKYRVVYTDFQRLELEKEFLSSNRYITIKRKAEIAEQLNLTERQVKTDFILFYFNEMHERDKSRVVNQVHSLG